MIILALLNSHVANYYLKVMNPTINFPPGYIQSVPFSNECRNLKVSKLSEECISISRNDWNAFETSWDFKCHPLISVISKIEYCLMISQTLI